MPITRPKPRQVGQAPTGLLNEKSEGVGGRSVKPVAGLVQSALKLRASSAFPFPFTARTEARPLPKVKAASIASSKRLRLARVSVMRSWRTSTVAGSRVWLGASSVRTIAPFSTTRRYPCWLRKAKNSVGFVPVGAGTAKVIRTV